MRRSDVVVVALSGDKPRPALVVQADDLTNSETVLVCPLTSGLEFATSHRVVVEPTANNGLRAPSVLMTEKMKAVRRDKCGQPIGQLEVSDMAAVNAQIAFVLGLIIRD